MEPDLDFQISWAKGWSPRKVEEILLEAPFRVGFKAISTFVLGPIHPGYEQSSAPRRTSNYQVTPCTRYAVHLAWNPYHSAQMISTTVLGLAVLSDQHPGADNLMMEKKTFGTHYTVVATATLWSKKNGLLKQGWWRLYSRAKGLALFLDKPIKKSGRFYERKWSPDD